MHWFGFGAFATKDVIPHPPGCFPYSRRPFGVMINRRHVEASVTLGGATNSCVERLRNGSATRQARPGGRTGLPKREKPPGNRYSWIRMIGYRKRAVENRSSSEHSDADHVEREMHLWGEETKANEKDWRKYTPIPTVAVHGKSSPASRLETAHWARWRARAMKRVSWSWARAWATAMLRFQMSRCSSARRGGCMRLRKGR